MKKYNRSLANLDSHTKQTFWKLINFFFHRNDQKLMGISVGIEVN